MLAGLEGVYAAEGDGDGVINRGSPQCRTPGQTITLTEVGGGGNSFYFISTCIAYFYWQMIPH